MIRDLKLTAKRGKTVDFLVGGYSLDDVATIARRVPDLKIILDHFGNVRLSEDSLDKDWVAAFKAVAKYPNVHCKVSALYGRVKPQPAQQNIAFYEPILELAYTAFGEDRLIYGSDWPVTENSGDYASVVKLTRAWSAQKGEAFEKKLFWSNGMRFYGVSDR